MSRKFFGKQANIKYLYHLKCEFNTAINLVLKIKITNSETNDVLDIFMFYVIDKNNNCLHHISC